jgi:hypothetical protein
MPDLAKDSGEGFLEQLTPTAEADAAGLKKAYLAYGPSWKQRGGVGAFMMLARKWDRMERRLEKPDYGYDIFKGIANDHRGEGLIDDVRDLRRYLMLVESEMLARGFVKQHRDNTPDPVELVDTGLIIRDTLEELRRAGHEIPESLAKKLINSKSKVAPEVSPDRSNEGQPR